MEYKPEELELKLLYYKSLPEKARRHFLALQYEQLGIGSQRYLSQVFSCGRKTITKGKLELSGALGATVDYSRQRKKGGGRKKREKNTKPD
jgi:hypothetical protein